MKQSGPESYTIRIQLPTDGNHHTKLRSFEKTGRRLTLDYRDLSPDDPVLEAHPLSAPSDRPAGITQTTGKPARFSLQAEFFSGRPLCE